MNWTTKRTDFNWTPWQCKVGLHRWIHSFPQRRCQRCGLMRSPQLKPQR